VGHVGKSLQQEDIPNMTIAEKKGRLMPRVTIYTTPFCPYCMAAKSLLKRKGADFEEIDVSRSPALRQAMIERAGGQYTVPQIFIGGYHAGGCDDLHALDAKGELDRLLQS
jgi:glutaredoxin 3